MLIAVGLSLCYLSNNWNIGAEGQLVMGAIFGGAVAIATHGVANGPWVLPAMMLAGMIGGALLAMVPAILKTRFGANEILTSLMLVYVAELLLDWLVRGPWRDPQGFNFPQSVMFEREAQMLRLFDGGRLQSRHAADAARRGPRRHLRRAHAEGLRDHASSARRRAPRASPAGTRASSHGRSLRSRARWRALRA